MKKIISPLFCNRAGKRKPLVRVGDYKAMTTETIGKLITIYQTKETKAKLIDASVLSLATSKQTNTYNQCLKLCEFINRKQELINLCRIFEEEFSLIRQERRKEIFRHWLNGQVVQETLNAFNVSHRTYYRSISEVKQALVKQFSFDGYTDEIVKELIQKAAI